MIRIRHRIDDRQARRAFTESPEVMTRNIEAQLEAGAQMIARTAKRNASQRMLFGNLTNSIVVERVGELHFRVQTGVNHARAVEEGTGPAAGRQRYFPNVQSLEQHIRQSRHMRGFNTWSRSKRKRATQERAIRDRAWGLAWHILDKGTKAYPYMAPSAEEHRSGLHRMVERGVWLGTAETFGP